MPHKAPALFAWGLYFCNKRYVQVRMTEAEHEIVRANGGSKFMRELLAPVAGIVSFMDARHTSPRAALSSFDTVCAEHFPDAPDWRSEV